MVHQFAGAHPLGAHHVAVNKNDGTRAATAGFGGEIILWSLEKLEKLYQIKGQKGTNVVFAGLLCLEDADHCHAQEPREYGLWRCHPKVTGWQRRPVTERSMSGIPPDRRNP